MSDHPTLFIDICAWSRVLGAALREAGIPFVAHPEQFPTDTPDDEWLRAAAGSGWLVVTRDQRIRYKANELAAVRDAGVHLFVFTQGGLSAAETARILCAAYPAMVRAASSRAPPAFWSLTRAAEVRPIAARVK